MDLSKVILQSSVVSDTETVLMPGVEDNRDSMADVHDPQVMPNTCSVMSSLRAGGMNVASNPIPEISYLPVRC